MTSKLLRRDQWKRGGKGVLDALLGAASWFGSPQRGDSIILFGGLAHESRGRLSKLRAALATGRIRLFVFTGTAMTEWGYDTPVSESWTSPVVWLCSWSGGGYEFVGYAGKKATDENTWLWRNGVECLYGWTSTMYILQLERTGPRVAIYLSRSREQMPHAAVIYPRPLPVCPPPAGTAPAEGQRKK